MKISDPAVVEETPKSTTLRNFPTGEVFYYNLRYKMKLKPTQFILNSTLVCDVLNRGDCFVCDIEQGTLYIMKGDTILDNLPDATLLIKKD